MYSVIKCLLKIFWHVFNVLDFFVLIISGNYMGTMLYFLEEMNETLVKELVLCFAVGKINCG